MFRHLFTISHGLGISQASGNSVAPSPPPAMEISLAGSKSTRADTTKQLKAK